MTALEMLEVLAAQGYKACWYARRTVESDPVPHVRVTSLDDGSLIYHTNYSLGTREQAQALLERNVQPAGAGNKPPALAKT